MATSYRTTPTETKGMPSGIPFIISNEAAERFSFYGMKAALAIFLANYLVALGGDNLNEAAATSYVSYFNSAVYLTPILGAFLADLFYGKYRTIITLSIVYCLGHLSLAMMGVGGMVEVWLLSGLGLIALGAGGIKPCVSAHVGDQFGKSNQHLLTRIFNIFYFSINAGAIVSNLLIPWVLKWYGPHWAFGIPGVLMALATLFFWMGRRRFIHVPANPGEFLRELFSAEGLKAVGKLTPLYLFVAIFWCLFDQTASSLVFQAEKMDLNILGIEVLPSQIQAFNPFLILIFIPLFTLVIYPTVNRFINFTPLRKIGTGLALMVVSFAVLAWAQEAIDRGETPSVGWQLLSYLIFTAAEILISIVCLEFSYTQAPRRIKSLIMAFFLVSVSIGNAITGLINGYIQIPEPAQAQLEAAVAKLEPGWEQSPRSIALPGFDGVTGTEDDFMARLKNGELDEIELPVENILKSPAEKVEALVLQRMAATGENETLAPSPEQVGDLGTDPWGNPIEYRIISAKKLQVRSAGPDKTAGTQWDQVAELTITPPSAPPAKSWMDAFRPSSPWLDRHGVQNQDEVSATKISYQVGGGTRLEGAAYFWFFTKLMAVTAILFIPFAFVYRPRTYMQH
ncbi:POT family MFS transporter [Haloferula rosea]|uniref:POT family MFS transporter n=1 Tax=Haloferula rosea TaxID=490093 RepID=A0A934RC21_9BACT|nr:POT family MFS transporter [Haloferula rosea]MBK1826993.1 POT family MFS transporter [Haloferula rosea]